MTKSCREARLGCRCRVRVGNLDRRFGVVADIFLLMRVGIVVGEGDDGGMVGVVVGIGCVDGRMKKRTVNWDVNGGNLGVAVLVAYNLALGEAEDQE